jgi:hypothetical protein
MKKDVDHRRKVRKLEAERDLIKESEAKLKLRKAKVAAELKHMRSVK